MASLDSIKQIPVAEQKGLVLQRRAAKSRNKEQNRKLLISKLPFL
jgi:hypothetical protein